MRVHIIINFEDVRFWNSNKLNKPYKFNDLLNATAKEIHCFLLKKNTRNLKWFEVQILAKSRNIY